MANYIMFFDGENDCYDVLEEQTATVIPLGIDQAEAAAMVDHLNNGGGFNGFTPAFILREWEHDLAA